MKMAARAGNAIFWGVFAAIGLVLGIAVAICVVPLFIREVWASCSDMIAQQRRSLLRSPRKTEEEGEAKRWTN